MPIDIHPPGARATEPSPTDALDSTGHGVRPGALLPSGDASTTAPVPAPHRALALDALAIRRLLRDRPRDAGPWGEPAFAREVDAIRRHLAPIASRRALASSFARESFRSPTLALSVERGAIEPVRLAYAVRWLELGDGHARPAWSGFIADLG